MPDQSSQILSVSASDLLGSFGVNTHSGMFDNDGYVNAALVIRSLDYIGIDTVRDNFRSDGVPGQVLQAMADAGVKFDFVASNIVAVNGSAGVQSFVDGVAAFAKGNPGQVIAIEGQNEVDLFGTNYAGDTSFAAAIKVQQQLYADVKANAALSGVSVYNMAMGREANYAAFGDLSDYSDYANVHFYAGAATDVAKRYANSVTLANNVTPGEGYVVTETGFTTAKAAAGIAVNELAQAKMTLTDLLMAYANGSSMSYVYQLLDTPTFENTTATSPEAEKYFGLFNADGSPKLAATALHNFTSLLNATGGSAMAGTVQVQGLGSDGHTLNVGKAAGGSDLVIWRDVSSWNTATNSNVAVASQPVTVSFSSVQAHVYVYSPLDGTTPIASYTNVSSITLPVSDTPLIVELGSSHPYVATPLVATDPTLTIDTASFIAQIDTLSKTSGITSVKLTDSHALEVASIPTMKDIIAHYGSLLGKIAGGYSFMIENVGSTSRIETAYDQYGTLTSTSNYALANGVATTLDVVYANGGSAHYSYKNGLTVDETHLAADGSRTTINYDSAGRTTQRVDISAKSVTTTLLYDVTSGAVSTKTVFNADKSGDVWHYGITGKTYVSDHSVYSAGNVLVSMTRLHADGSRDYYEQRNADGSIQQDFYTAAGVISQEVRTAADGSRATTTYDSAGRMIQDVSAVGVTSTWAYDASGAVATKTVFKADKSGDVWHYGITGKTYVADHAVYTAGNVLASMTRLHADGSRDYYEQRNADGSTVQDFYSAAGLLTQEVRVSASGARATTTYDAQGRMVQDVTAANVTSSWTYDATSGALTSKSVFNADKSGTVSHYGITGKSYTSDQYVYAANGSVASLTRYHADGTRDYYEKYGSDGSVVYDYYSASGVLTQEVQIGANGMRSTFSYDGAGRLTQRQEVSASNVTTNWTYDAASGATTMKTSFNADKSGMVWHYGITGKSYTSDQYVYNANGSLYNLTRYHADGTRDYFEQHPSDGSAVYDYYSATGVLTQEVQIAANGSRSTYTYNGAGRLTQRQDVSASNVTTTWAYDTTSGATTMKTLFNADKSGMVWHYGITGKSYTSDQYVYTASGSLYNVTRYHADGTRDYFEQHTSDGSAVYDYYSAKGILTLEVQVGANGSRSTYSYDSAGRLAQRQDISTANSTTTWSYESASGAMTSKTIFNADKSGVVWTYGITGKSYTSDQTVYSANNTLASVSRFHADGTLDYFEQRGSDGSTAKEYYNAAGVISQKVLVAADGGSAVRSYDTTGHVTTQVNTSGQQATTIWTFDPVTGDLKSKSVTNADKSGEQFHYGITGQTYVSDHVTFFAGGAAQSLTRYHADGTLDFSQQNNADGSKLLTYYDATGEKTLEAFTAASGAKSFHAYAEAADQGSTTAKLLSYSSLSGTNLKLAGTPTVNLVDGAGNVLKVIDASMYSIVNGVLTLDTHAVAGLLNEGTHANVDVTYTVTDGTTVAPKSVYSIDVDGTASGTGILLPADPDSHNSVPIDTIYGDAGGNIFDTPGAHIFVGGKGDDIYFIDNANSKVIELAGASQGYDIIYSSVSQSIADTYVEELRLTGTANINATGSSRADVLRGNSGNNIIDGQGGDDTLFGGGGNDVFVFSKSGHAKIGDFDAGDTIDLSAFLKAGKTATLSETADGTMVTIDSGTSILVEGLAMSHLIKDSGGFHFG
ncbi:hypothetical protein HL653_04280 [Sphingomonas sp. AP4-R1]|uniref:hypothetical protein n=1 Tax=Sphingomonas sp. AP4-R1 TaxID=2735134 RepID=UPI001493CE2A|nr:hypothetical protein [Sphingomonas sp. AP4-R1]QJU57107.1 hypothetical protein HL653_04280 [Sphingomonas sp. AP4-R1]